MRVYIRSTEFEKRRVWNEATQGKAAFLRENILKGRALLSPLKG